MRSCHFLRDQTRCLDADTRSCGVHAVVELLHVDDDRIGQRPVVTRVQQILEDAAQHVTLEQLGPLLGEAGGQLVRSLDHRGRRAHQVVEEELVARVEVLDALERGFVGCQDRVPRDRGHDRALQRVRNHSPRSLLPLRAGEVRQPVAEPGILGAHLRDDIEAGNLGDQPTVVHHVLSDPCAHLLAGVVPIRLPSVLESVGPQDLGCQPVVQLGVEGLHDLMSSGDLVVGQPTLGCSGELHDRQLDELPILLGERVRRRSRHRPHLDAELLAHRVEHGGRVVGDRLRRVVGVLDLERLRRGHLGEWSQVADGAGRLDHRLLRQVARLVLGQDRDLRLRGHRRRQHTGVAHGVVAFGGSIHQRQIPHHRSRARVLGVHLLLDGVRAQQGSERHVAEELLRHLAGHRGLEEGREEHRPQDRAECIVLVHLDDDLSGQAVPLDRVATVIHDDHRLDQLRRILQQVGQRVRCHRRKPRLLSRAELTHRLDDVGGSDGGDVLCRLALVRGVLQHQQVAVDSLVHRLRSEGRTEVLREPEPAVQRVQQSLLLRRAVAAQGTAQLGEHLAVQLHRRHVLVLVLGELLRLLVELGDGGADVRRHQLLRELALGVGGVDGGEVGVPRGVGRLVLPQQVLLVVDPRNEHVHVGHVRELGVEPLLRQLHAGQSQSVHQQVEAIADVVVRPVRLSHRVPPGDEQATPQDRLGLLLGTRGQRVQQELGGTAVVRDRRGGCIVGQHVEVRLRQRGVRLEEPQHLGPVGSVESLDPPHRCPHLLERGPESSTGGPGLLAQRTAHLLAGFLLRVVVDLLARRLEQGVHDTLVRGDLPTLVVHPVRHVVLAGLARVRGVLLEHRLGKLAVVVVLVHHLGMDLAQRQVAAEHIAAQAEQFAHGVAAEHLDERLTRAQAVETVEPRGVFFSPRSTGCPVLLHQLLTQEPLQHRLLRRPAVQASLAVLVADELRHLLVGERHLARETRRTLVQLLPRERPQLADHIAGGAVLDEDLVDLRLTHVRVESGVHLGHLAEDGAVRLGDLVLVGAHRGVVQRLPVTEDVLAGRVHPKTLGNRRCLCSNTTAVLRLGVDRVVGVVQQLRPLRAVARSLSTLEVPERLPDQGVHAEPGVHPLLIGPIEQVGLAGLHDPGQEVRLRLRVPVAHLGDQLVHCLVHAGDVGELTQQRLLQAVQRGVGRVLRGDGAVLQRIPEHRDRVLLPRGGGQDDGVDLGGTQERAVTHVAELVLVHDESRQHRQLVAVEVATHAHHRSVRHLDLVVADALGGIGGARPRVL